MSSNQRHKNGNWAFPTTPSGAIAEWQFVSIAVLMDIRDELQKLNALLHCQNAVDIPKILRRIDANTKKRPRKKAKP